MTPMVVNPMSESGSAPLAREWSQPEWHTALASTPDPDREPSQGHSQGHSHPALPANAIFRGAFLPAAVWQL